MTSVVVAPESTKFLRPENQRFLETLRGYLDCRAQMDAKYQEVDEFQVIANFELDDEPIISTQQISSCFQQKSILGAPIASMEELYEAAETALPIYTSKMHGIVDKIESNYNNNDVQLTIADLKKEGRIQEKANNDYLGYSPGPPISWVFDVVRGSIEFSTVEQFISCLRLLQEEPDITIFKSKNRFSKPELTGYRDWNIQFQLDCGDGFGHACEIQLHHQAIRTLDTSLGSHAYYEYFRWFFAGGKDSLKDRLDDLKVIAAGGMLDESHLNSLLCERADPDRLERLGALFESYLCEYELALQVRKKILVEQKRIFGEDSVQVCDAYDHIGRVLKIQGKLEEAKTMYEKSLEIKLNVLGGTHTAVAESYGSLAVILAYQGYHDEARLMLEEESNIHMDLHRKLDNNELSKDHATAQTYLAEGKLEEAKTIYEHILEVKLKAGEKGTLDAAHTYKALGKIYEAQYDYGCAEEMYQRSVDLEIQALGPEHKSLAGSYFNLAYALKEQGKLEQAIKTYRDARKIYWKSKGEKHPLVRLTSSRIAMILREQGKLEEAQTILEQVLQMEKQSLGDGHHEVATTYENLYFVLRDQGKQEEAREMRICALRSKVKALGDDHPEVPAAYDSLAILLADQKKFEESESVYARVLEIRLRTFGRNEEVGKTYKHLADAMMEQRKLDAAFEMYKAAESIFLGCESRNYHRLASIYSKLADLQILRGQEDEAKELRATAHRMIKSIDFGT